MVTGQIALFDPAPGRTREQELRHARVLLAQARVFRRRAYANGRRDAFHWWLFNAACRATRRAARTAR